MTDRTTGKNVAIFGDHEANTLAQLDDVASRAERAALMADGHLGYVMPIGGVAAYREQVSVVGVGFDIACGNAAIRTDLTLARHARACSSGCRRSPTRSRTSCRSASAARIASDDAPVDHALFEQRVVGRGAAARSATSCGTRRARSSARSAAAITTSTCSPTRTDAIWVGVHFGSRGFGHTVASGFLALSQGEEWGAARARARGAARRSTRRSATTTGR